MLETEASETSSAGRSSGLRLKRSRTAFPRRQCHAVARMVRRPRRSQRRPRNGFAPFSLLSPCPQEQREPVETTYSCSNSRRLVQALIGSCLSWLPILVLGPLQPHRGLGVARHAPVP